MKVKFKKIQGNATKPEYAKEGDCAMDLVATSMRPTKEYIEYGTGIALEIPKGYFGMLRPRSSVSGTGLIFNTSGLIDSGYRGEILFRYKHVTGLPQYALGERCGQIVILPYPEIELEEAVELSSSLRGESGHGSTGK